jgi:ornithine carbamoyltransferase
MVYEKNSTRTRVSFEVGVQRLGGIAVNLDAQTTQLSRGESIEDTALVLSRYADVLIYRAFRNADVAALSRHASVPVINALDDKDHPCQVMADILTLREKYGPGYKKKKIVMSWVYTKRQKSPGVLHSMLVAASMLGMTVTFCHPKGFELDPEYLAFAERAGKETNSRIEFCDNLHDAAAGADVIYGKNWKSLTMSTEEDMRVREAIKDDWCISKEHFDRANPGAYYMDCMPFIRGEQVTAEVADGENSIVYDQAENRLHIQKAILASLL